jgi:competence protein ComEC
MTLARMPMVPLALSLALGIAATPWVPSEVAWPALIGALGWSLSLIVLGWPGWASACLLLGVAAAGALRASELPPALDHLVRQPLPMVARLAGRLVAEPVRLAPDRARLLVDAEQLDGRPVSGRVPITVYGEPSPPLTQGQHVEAPVHLYRATGFRNPGGFDYAEKLRREGVLVVATARADRITALDEPRPPWPVRVRRAAIEAAAQALPPASAALLGGLLLGDRSGMPREMDEAFRRAGVYHVLAVSGFNVAIVGGAVWGLLTLAHLGQRAAAIGAIATIVAFALIVGPEPSVLRAVIMGVLVLGALLLDREASILNSLALAAVTILIIRPSDLLDPGFQLSFAATAALVLAPHPRNLVLGALSISLAAQLGVLPVALVHFNQLSTLGPLANLVVVPLAAAATVLGLLAVGLAFVSQGAADILFNAAWPVLIALRGTVALVASVPGALLHLPAPAWPAVTAYVLGLGLALVWWRGRATPRRCTRWAGVSAVLFLAVAVAIGLWPILRLPDGRLRVSVLDVGQGDAILVETPDGQAMLVDAGPGGPKRLDAGERVVAPVLWNRGIMALAAAVTTHDDRDHAGGMEAIRRAFTIGETLGPGDRRQRGGATLAVLPVVGTAARVPRNGDALVLRVDYGHVSFLLASDIDAAAETRLASAGLPLAATVLKVAHHGSRRSSTEPFLERVRPALAVISVGARNSYGHPGAETLERLAAVGARVYRTDRDGAVLFETDGAMLSVTRWASGQTDRYCLDPDGVC